MDNGECSFRVSDFEVGECDTDFSTCDSVLPSTFANRSATDTPSDLMVCGEGKDLGDRTVVLVKGVWCSGL